MRIPVLADERSGGMPIAIQEGRGSGIVSDRLRRL